GALPGRPRRPLAAAARVAVGAVLGWLAGSGRLDAVLHARTDPPAAKAGGAEAAQPLAQAGQKADPPAKDGKKPNILIIWGDDIGWFNPSFYHPRLPGYPTPNIHP